MKLNSKRKYYASGVTQRDNAVVRLMRMMFLLGINSTLINNIPKIEAFVDRSWHYASR